MLDFEPIDWNEDIDLAAVRAGIDKDAMVRGVFFDSAIKLAKRQANKSLGRGQYSALRNYPALELVEVLVECAQLVYPKQSLRQALRLIGQQVFVNLLDIPAATFMFSVAGRDAKKIFKLIERAYKLFSSGATTSLREEDDAMIVVMRKHWLFADSYHCGIFEGAIRANEADAEIAVRRYSLCDVDIRIKIKS